MHVFIIIFNAVNFWLNAKKQSIYNCCSYFREKLLNLFPRLNPRFFLHGVWCMAVLLRGCFRHTSAVSAEILCAE